MDEDLDDLLDEITVSEKVIEAPTVKGHVLIPRPKVDASQGQKCQPIFVGGSMTSRGLATRVSPKCCDRLMCLACDFKVVTFDEFTWAPQTDYLFLRNNVPEFSRLKSNLKSSPGSRAYACQCRWLNARKYMEINPHGTGAGTDAGPPKWICMKH